MEVIITLIIIVILLLCIVIFGKIKNNKLENQIIVLQEKVNDESDNVNRLEQNSELLNNYIGRFEQMQFAMLDLKEKNKDLMIKIESLQNNLHNNEIEKRLFEEKSKNLEKEKSEWSHEKEKLLYKLSEELIRKNKEEQEKFGQNQQEEIKNITKDLFKNFENIANKVSSLNDDVKKTSDDINLTKNALLNPGGAGRTSEITLENILKSSGLMQKLSSKDVGDYILQSHFSDAKNNSKRPDALIFLPENHILIIDSKSSSHFLELQKAKDLNDNNLMREISDKIKIRIKNHLEELKKKSYVKSKLEDLDHMFNKNNPPVISMAMFLQSEKMIDIIREIYPDFEQKCIDEKIWLIGPIGLINILNQSKFIINSKKQSENIDLMRMEVKKIIESIGTLLVKSQDVGKSLYRGVKSFNEFASSFNSRFLPRIANMTKYGIEFDHKNFKNPIEKYNIETSSNLIELDDEVNDIDKVE